ncbi:unnamed protein product [Allacma fusca]|uniref:Chromo domain-containing protein n=1 Tax=Allacma fusca TaxID=39272 RepID=A0A8J2JVB0_9HEXA|nr:unnamed protein product [Allacma fusca]
MPGALFQQHREIATFNSIADPSTFIELLMTLPPVTAQDKLLTPTNPNDGEYFVKAINGIASDIDNSNKVVYKIWWDGYPAEASTWQTYEDISNIHYVLPEYHDLIQKKLQDLRQSEPNSRIVQFWSPKSIAKLWTAETSVCKRLEPDRSIKGLGQDPRADESGQNQVNSLKSEYPKRAKSKTNLAEQPNKLECGVCSFSGQQNIFSNHRELKRHERLEHKVAVNAWSKKKATPPPKQVVKARVGRAEEKLTDVSVKECDYDGSCYDCVTAGSKYVTLVNMTKCCLVNLSVIDISFIDVVRSLLHCNDVPTNDTSMVSFLLLIVWILLGVITIVAAACTAYCVWNKRGWPCMRVFRQLANDPAYGSLIHSSVSFSAQISPPARPTCESQENSIELRVLHLSRVDDGEQTTLNC